MDSDSDTHAAKHATRAAKRAAYFAEHPADISLADIDLERLPAHITIIMDGNGRWAQARGLARSEGHRAGVNALRETITASVRLGIDYLSAYAFSTENWHRPKAEVELLMQLFATTLVNELPLFDKENVRLEFLGDIDALPTRVRDTFRQGLDRTAHYTGMTLALAVNYGSRAEISRAARLLAIQAAQGALNPNDINEEMVSGCLYTANIPDPDVLIRTSGELRLSNYLLWQMAYTEFFATEVFWPDFDRFELLRAIRAYQDRDRRFGKVSS